MGVCQQCHVLSPLQQTAATKQAKLLALFDDLGVLHKEQKQVAGSPLQIIGFEMTITMSPEARDELISAVQMFADPHQQRSC